jgi:hypothetical protein
MLSYLIWFVGIASFELVSALTIFHPMAHGVALVASALFLAVLAYRKPSLAASILLAEYVIGSKGALLRFGGDGVGHGGVPLRIALFAAFLVGWLVWSIQHKTYRDWASYLRGRTVYIVLAGLLVYAFLRGYFLHNAFMFDDANAWGVWLLLLPALDLARHERAALYRFVPSALLTAFVWMALKTLGLFFLFSHLTNPAWLDALYLWVRRTGVGEITRALASANVWRVFFQSHIYLLPAIFGFAWYTVSKKYVPRVVWMVSVLAWAVLLVSLSRSLMIGVGAGLLASAGLLFFFRHDIGYAWSTGAREYTPVVGIGRVLAMMVGSVLLVAGLFYAPPRPSGSLADLFASRTDLAGDAVVSRWMLLPALMQGIERHPLLGSGFGATITYTSHDPRVVAATGGSYTTYAFEWGWLDHWFKFGLLGIPLMLWIVARLLLRSWRSSQPFWIRATLATSLLALIATHFFTPYLNHPLGIAWLVSVEAWLSMEFA